MKEKVAKIDDSTLEAEWEALIRKVKELLEKKTSKGK